MRHLLRLRSGRNVFDMIALRADALHVALARSEDHRLGLAHVTTAVSALIAMIYHRSFWVTKVVFYVNTLESENERNYCM